MRRIKRWEWKYFVAMAAFGIAFVVMLIWIWSSHEECSRRVCADGLEPHRLSGLCVCVARPKP
jgi:hypothetical protein